jgi:large subunit ribosomal protein L16
MAIPKKMKYRKYQRGRTKGRDFKGSKIDFGEWAIKAVSVGYLSERELEAARRAMTRYMKRGGKVWMRVFPDRPVTAKPLESRMGKGKGDVDHFAAVIRPGRIIFEISGVSSKVAQRAFQLASHKLSVKTKVIERKQV